MYVLKRQKGRQLIVPLPPSGSAFAQSPACPSFCNYVGTSSHVIAIIKFISAVAGQVGMPPAVNKTNLTSTSVLLRWNHPVDPNGIITKYRVNVMAVSTDPGAMGIGSGNRRRRQVGLNTNCIMGEVGLTSNFTTSDNETALFVTSLCENFSHHSRQKLYIFCSFNQHLTLSTSSEF